MFNPVILVNFYFDSRMCSCELGWDCRGGRTRLTYIHTCAHTQMHTHCLTQLQVHIYTAQAQTPCFAYKFSGCIYWPCTSPAGKVSQRDNLGPGSYDLSKPTDMQVTNSRLSLIANFRRQQALKQGLHVLPTSQLSRLWEE